MIRSNYGPFLEQSALHIAATNGHLEVVRLLIEKAPQLLNDNLWKNRRGAPPLDMVDNHHPEIKKFLEEAKQKANNQKSAR